MTNSLNCVSWNVRGIIDPIKRGKILSYLKRINTDIAFIQETYLTDQEHKRFRREWVGQVFYSSFSSSGRGIALLIQKKYIIVECEINGEYITIVNFYGPNHDDPTVYSKLILRLATILLEIDPQKNYPSLKLRDIWRFFLVSQTIEHQMKDCTYLSVSISDHNPAKLIWEPTTITPQSKNWRFRSYMLKDPNFIQFMTTQIIFFLETNANSASHSIIWEALKAFMRGHNLSYGAYKIKEKRARLRELENEIRTLELEHSMSNNEKTLTQLTQKRILYNNLCTQKIESNMQKKNQNNCN
uniref:exodeoxyribonuclease III n=1 Tax=Paramormyrops kingsleyae TaxID=1676925 RepID=A0A3B3SRR6_9TELE